MFRLFQDPNKITNYILCNVSAYDLFNLKWKYLKQCIVIDFKFFTKAVCIRVKTKNTFK